MVSQETLLLSGSARENILYGRPRATEEELYAAARAANADEFIRALPRGYDSLIGERGAKLSGGQKQRLAMARAFICNPRILILDEATSALDTESEPQIQSALEQLMNGARPWSSPTGSPPCSTPIASRWWRGAESCSSVAMRSFCATRKAPTPGSIAASSTGSTRIPGDPRPLRTRPDPATSSCRAPRAPPGAALVAGAAA